MKQMQWCVGGSVRSRAVGVHEQLRPSHVKWVIYSPPPFPFSFLNSFCVLSLESPVCFAVLMADLVVPLYKPNVLTLSDLQIVVGSFGIRNLLLQNTDHHGKGLHLCLFHDQEF